MHKLTLSQRNRVACDNEFHDLIDGELILRAILRMTRERFASVDRLLFVRHIEIASSEPLMYDSALLSRKACLCGHSIRSGLEW